MSKAGNQKLKLLYLLSILKEKTDEEHGLTLAQIIKELDKYGITSERKSLYSDIELLSKFGYDIVGNKKGRCFEYKLVSGRHYQLAEVKLMVDAIQSTRFITHKKSAELIKKLEKEVSVYEAKELQRTVFIEKRSKTDNESIYISIDQIYRAIQSKKQITFNYYEWTVSYGCLSKVTERPRKNGQLYRVSPWCMLWNDEKYYLVAYDSYSNKIKHYRVDKIKNVNVLDEMSEGEEAFKGFDVPTYVKQNFGMFSGDELREVTIRIANKLIGVIIDRFGSDYQIVHYDDDYSDVTVTVYVTQQFFGWLFGLGDEVTIISPVSVVKQYRKSAKKIAKSHKL
ncbi:MAG: WYL domain-containing protein [Acutalibacteraceae bacterium]|nr:WYL domain-containing protein [Acutalibacteraceae bacterium]